jgi:hypothetical protein
MFSLLKERKSLGCRRSSSIPSPLFSQLLIRRQTGKVRTGPSYSFRPKSSHASAAQIVSDATVNHHGPQRIGIKTKIRNNSHHPAERFCEGGGATSVVFSEGTIVSSPLSPAHFISYSALEAPQLLICRLPGHFRTITNLYGRALIRHSATEMCRQAC